MQNIVIFGATSAIAQAVAKLFAEQSANIALVARNEGRLESIAQDLKIRGAKACEVFVSDLAQTDSHPTLIEQIEKQLGQIDTALIAHGTMPAQEDTQDSYEATLDVLQTNGLSAISLMLELSKTMATRSAGTIAVISSPAGDRGRSTNYVYGTAKAMVSVYAQGLRNRMAKQGVHVLTIKPGFVDTPMTADMDKQGPLWTQPEKVGQDIFKAIEKQRNVIYTPFFWQWIMLIIKHIPEFIFKKLSI